MVRSPSLLTTAVGLDAAEEGWHGAGMGLRERTEKESRRNLCQIGVVDNSTWDERRYGERRNSAE